MLHVIMMDCRWKMSLLVLVLVVSSLVTLLMQATDAHLRIVMMLVVAQFYYHAFVDVDPPSRLLLLEDPSGDDLPLSFRCGLYSS